MSRKNRIARGFHADLCQQCKTGLGYGQLKLFDPRCEGCHDKKAQGLRTGNEPAPTRRLGEKIIDHHWQAQQRAARAKFLAATLTPRTV